MPPSEALQPFSPSDHHLFNLFAEVRLDIHALADRTGRDLAGLTAWAAADHIQAWCRAYIEISGLRNQALRNDALAALRETLHTPNLVEKRRAATALLRALAKPAIPLLQKPSAAAHVHQKINQSGPSSSIRPPTASAPPPQAPSVSTSAPQGAAPEPARPSRPPAPSSSQRPPLPSRDAAPRAPITHAPHEPRQHNHAPQSIPLSPSSTPPFPSASPSLRCTTSAAGLLAAAGRAGPAP